MGSLSLAISIGRDIERIGSIAGYAAILGLAVLSLLYFAQSREVKRLREWAGRAPERDAELQQRVAEEAARRAAGATATAPPPATPAPRPTGAGIPATAAAQAAAKPAAGAPAVGAPKPAAPGTPAPAGAAGKPPGPPTPANPPTPSPAPGAPPAAGAPKPPVPAASPGKASPVPPPPATAAAAARPRRTVTVGSTPSSATVPPRPDGGDGGSGIGPRAIGAGVLGVALVVVVLLVSGVLGGGGDDDPGTNGAQTAPSTTTATTDTQSAIPAPADTSVAVLNGTTVPGLAKEAADQLEARDYSVVRVTDAADQAQQVSQVAYSEGFDGSARRIARIVGVDAGNIVVLDASTRVVAGEDASVVVTMGADKAQ